MCQRLIWERKKDGIEERKKAHGEYQELILDKRIENIRKQKHLNGRGESRTGQLVQKTSEILLMARGNERKALNTAIAQELECNSLFLVGTGDTKKKALNVK